MNIKEFRKQYPQYNDMDDATLAKTFHKKYYSDIPYNEFASKFGVSQPTIGDTATRAVKQIANVPAELIKGTAGLIGGSLVNLYEQLTTPLDEVPQEHRTSLWKGLIDPAGETGRKIAEKIPVPEFEISPAETTGQKISDVVVGVGKFVSEVALLRKASPKTPEAVLWGIQALLSGESPATGYAMGKTFGVINKLPVKSEFQKGLKLLTESGAITGIAALEGERDPVKLATMAAIPGGFRIAGKVTQPFRPGPRVPVAGPDVVKRGQPGSPEVPEMATAEGSIQKAQAEAQQQQINLENRGRVSGQFAAEIEAKQRAYDDLLNAVGSGDVERVNLARQTYEKVGPPTQEQVQKASDAGNPEAQVRLNEGFFQADWVDVTTPLSKKERSIAKRMGYGKALTDPKGPMTPGQVRAIIQGDQKTLAEAPKPEPVKETEIETKPESKLTQELIKLPEGEPKTELDRDLIIAKKRKADTTARHINPKTGQVTMGPIEPWFSSRYMLDDMSDLAGMENIPRWVARIHDHIRLAEENISTNSRKALEDSGLPKSEEAIISDPIWSKTVGEQAQIIADMRHSKDWSRATPEQKIALQKIEALDQTIGANEIRRLRWELWRYANEIPESMKGDPKQATQTLKEGIEVEKSGNIDAWLKEQFPEFARKEYFMQERSADLLEGVHSILFGDKSAPSTFTGMAKERRAQTKAVQTINIIDDLIQHYQVIARARVSVREMSDLWAKTKQANFDSRTLDALKQLYKNALEVKEPLGPGELEVVKVNKLFWDLQFADPRFIGRWGLQNALQIPYMLTHFTPKAVVQGARQLVVETRESKRDPERLEALEQYMGSKSLQNKELIQVLKDAERAYDKDHPKSNLLPPKMRKTFRTFQKIASLADPMVRTLTFNIYFAGAKKTLTAFQQGKTEWNQVTKDLKLKLLDPAQYEQVDYYVRHGEMGKAAGEIAKAKNAATHGEYGIIDRAMVEQKPIMRAVLGPMVYPRSILEMGWRQGIKPIIDGMKYGDYQMSWQGVKALAATTLVTYGAAKTYEVIVGKQQSLWSIILPQGSPGLDLLFGTFDKLELARWQATEQGLTEEQILDKLLNIGVTTLEQSLPMVDIVADYYESTHNVKGARLYTLLKARLSDEWYKKYKKQWKIADRTEWESTMHIITGGFEQGFEQKEQQAKKNVSKQSRSSRTVKPRKLQIRKVRD